MKSSKAPKVFISYAWESEEFNNWIKTLAVELRSDGIDVILDQWAVEPGDQLPEFMEKSIRESNYTLIICTPAYKEKSESRAGGVGYEGHIITADVFSSGNHRKFIPIVHSGERSTSIPSWALGKVSIDCSETNYKRGYRELLATITGTREKAPPIGVKIKPIEDKFRETPVAESSSEIKIIAVIEDEVTEPRYDNTPGGGLYKVPFVLSHKPSREWALLFVRTWDNPPKFTTMHRPGIARVVGNKIILDGTTVEEVNRYHRDTLVAVIKEVNSQIAVIAEARELKEKQEKERSEKHRDNVRNLAQKISFD